MGNCNICERKTDTKHPPQNRTPRSISMSHHSLDSSSNNYHLDTRNTNPFEVFEEHIVVAMVGLPARGKSYLSRSIIRYLNFLGCRAKLFNAGNLRRERGLAGTDANFFDATNESAKAMREEMAMECLEQLLEWVQGPGCSVGILDATNTTVARRAKLIERCRREELEGDTNIRLVFVESVADDPVLLESNYRMKLSNDDYGGKDREQALADFRERVRKYEAVYEPISDELDGASTRYIKLINAGQKLISNNLDGFVTRKIQRLLGSVHLEYRNIWLVLVGETENDKFGVLGGDFGLSSDGLEYSREIFNIISKRERSTNTMLLLTGTLQRYKTMVREYHKSDLPNCNVLTLGAANDLCSGLMDSLSLEEREERFPEETKARRNDRLNYRYPGVGGESYQDLIARCNEIVCHLEQIQGDALVIADRSVYRAIMGYFTSKSIEEVPFLDVQPGVLELRRNHSGFSTTQLSTKVGKATSSAGIGTAPYLNHFGSSGNLRTFTL